MGRLARSPVPRIQRLRVALHGRDVAAILCHADKIRAHIQRRELVLRAFGEGPAAWLRARRSPSWERSATVPTLFIRRYDKRSTVNVWRDSADYLVKLIRFRRQRRPGR